MKKVLLALAFSLYASTAISAPIVVAHAVVPHISAPVEVAPHVSEAPVARSDEFAVPQLSAHSIDTPRAFDPDGKNNPVENIPTTTIINRPHVYKTTQNTNGGFLVSCSNNQSNLYKYCVEENTKTTVSNNTNYIFFTVVGLAFLLISLFILFVIYY